MKVLIRLAAALLPAGLRDRYREQWLGDFDRADELGIRPSSIAIGSLVFAARVDRPFSAVTPVKTAQQLERRSSLAVGLALSSAVLALSQFANLFGFGVSANDPAGFAIFVATAVLMIYWAIAAILAVVFVSAARGVSSRVRIAVCLLVLGALAGVVQSVVDNRMQIDGFPFLSLGCYAYVADLVAIAVAMGLVRRRSVSERARRA